jgi:hypothetical protein
VVADPARSLPHDLVLPLGWATPVASFTGANTARDGDPYKIAPEKLAELLRQRGILSTSNPTDPAKTSSPRSGRRRGFRRSTANPRRPIKEVLPVA